MNKYLKIFENHSQYVEPTVRPNVSYCRLENEVHYTLSPEIITFTISGTSYQAEEGMTWHEWIDSDYNTNGWQEQTYNNVTYIWKSGESIKGNNNHDETPSDVILDEHVYTTVINDPGLVI